jgi:hypothetical protein
VEVGKHGGGGVGVSDKKDREQSACQEELKK